MLHFILGLVVGGIVGVICDRVYRVWENRPRFDIHTGVFDHISGMQGMTFDITNRGSATTPPYRICLFSPSRGSLYLDTGDGAALEPGQTNNHRLNLHHNGQPINQYNMIPTWLNEPKGTDKKTFFEYEFKLEMEKSKVPLFRSKRMGRAFARKLYEWHNMTPPAELGKREWNEMIHLGWRSKIRNKLEVRRMTKQIERQRAAEAANPKPKPTA